MVSGGLVLVKPSFSREKDGFWRSSPGKTIFFSRKRWFFEGWLLKTIFFSRKRWFRTKTPSFSRENQKTIFFSRKRWFLEILSKKPSFSREKDGFWKKPSFSREKDGSWRSCPGKTIFLFGFEPKKTIFFSRKPKKPSFGGPSPIVLEKMVFLVFLVLLVCLVFWIFLVCWFLLVSCFVVFCLDLARTRLPSAVGPLGGGGEHIYVYIYIHIGNLPTFDVGPLAHQPVSVMSIRKSTLNSPPHCLGYCTIMTIVVCMCVCVCVRASPKPTRNHLVASFCQGRCPTPASAFAQDAPHRGIGFRV